MAKAADEPLPQLTATSMRAFRNVVASYGPRVVASGGPAPDQRAALDLVETLTAMLDHIDGQSPSSWSAWVRSYSGHFRALNTYLTTMKILSENEPVGACFYVGGCVETTATGCMGLGRFVQGATCDSAHPV